MELERGRRFYSIIPLALITLILARLNPATLVLMPLGILALRWYSMGAAFVAAVGVYLVYARAGGFLGLTLISLALLTAEMAYLDRERAPAGHYIVLLTAVFLAFPTYFLMAVTAPLVPRLEVTAVAAVLVLSLYLFSKLATD
ncbi:hypothetical protein [Thermococcus sp.]|uniref:hypothetical protein n=1 Tax=Thermococcus sp. TaxID=35749 RepID=UPI002628F4EA|nr:hypothetical protein [Thermococcus sp.]